MPANLTPEYKRAEERLREAKSPDEKLAALEEMLRVMPKHKGTDGLQADIKARIAKLRKQPATKAGKSTFSHMVPREGAGQVALVGPPNTGKSSLVTALTHAAPAIGDYPFTTREATPGMMPFEDVAFQLIDLPPLSDQHVDPWVFDLIRAADMAWVVLDGRYPLEGMDDTERLLAERKVTLQPACRDRVADYSTDATSKAALVVLTGADRPGVADAVPVLDDLFNHRWPLVAVSSTARTGLDALARRTFEALRIIRVYTKQPGKPADRSKPFTLPDGATVDDLLRVLNVPTGAGRPLVSVNRFYLRENAPLADGDRVQLLKTVIGGCA
jgi:ribosome-interacting GTPase 1